MSNLFKTGDMVCAKVNPTRPLVVRVFARGVYYCDVKNHPEEKEQVYFEREIMTFNKTA
ncbi:hypothetical protein [Sinomicrobium weinanense]|uniref:DUF2158 domain-containing protein n=1 Tax=Sinomicrobium weinanense TaxID=2842200 RepID=A0A926JR84_9FLAO|nr:hypothetical protein [Sinomicrobium weinanense]MBC9796020.1 hypothetical protein [Sinomicrobium weinanense]MBU3123161.1 hypothetical protein [Sinomicrobium weinanense]